MAKHAYGELLTQAWRARLQPVGFWQMNQWHVGYAGAEGRIIGSMKIRALGLIWLGGALLATSPARAQYAAPGFPMLPQGRLQPVVKAPAKLQSPILPRFWHEADPGKLAAGRTEFFTFVSEHARFPDGAKPTAAQPKAPLPTGRLLVRVLVRPDGSVRQPPHVLRRELSLPESAYLPSAIQALDAEALRVLGALRFVRSKSVQDSLVVPMRFIEQ